MIQRSSGIVVNAGGIPWIIGGGYNGITQELDAVVEEAAKLLLATFNSDIEIRFNSNRRSGGAWLKNGIEGIWGNATIGITAGIIHIQPEDMNDNEWFSSPFSFRESQPEKIMICIYVKRRALKDKNLAPYDNFHKDDSPENEPYVYLELPDVKAAIEWIRNNTNGRN